MNQNPRIPKPGDVVSYSLSAHEAALINRKILRKENLIIDQMLQWLVKEGSQCELLVEVVEEDHGDGMHTISGKVLTQGPYDFNIRHATWGGVNPAKGYWTWPAETNPDIISFPGMEVADEEEDWLSRLSVPSGKLPSTKDMLDRSIGMLLQLDEDGCVMQGQLVFEPDEVRGHAANMVIWFDPYAPLLARAAAMACITPKSEHSICTVSVYTKSETLLTQDESQRNI